MKSDSANESERLIAFKKELLIKRVINSLYVLGACVGALFLVAVFSGGKFAEWMGGVGISFVNSESGVYADCSKKENRNVAYCRPKEAPTDRNWKNLTHKGSKFTLY